MDIDDKDKKEEESGLEISKENEVPLEEGIEMPSNLDAEEEIEMPIEKEAEEEKSEIEE